MPRAGCFLWMGGRADCGVPANLIRFPVHAGACGRRTPIGRGIPRNITERFKQSGPNSPDRSLQ